MAQVVALDSTSFWLPSSNLGSVGTVSEVAGLSPWMERHVESRARIAMRYLAVGVFVVLTAMLGAMVVPFFVWVFSLGLLPQWASLALAVPSGAFTGYWGYQHTVDKDWLDPA